jgi:hypothetical protein
MLLEYESSSVQLVTEQTRFRESFLGSHFTTQSLSQINKAMAPIHQARQHCQ